MATVTNVTKYLEHILYNALKVKFCKAVYAVPNMCYNGHVSHLKGHKPNCQQILVSYILYVASL